MIIKLIYAILLIWWGATIIKYRKIVKSWTWNFVWAEQYIWRGGTYIAIILIWLAMIFYWAIYPFWWAELFISK